VEPPEDGLKKVLELRHAVSSLFADSERRAFGERGK
jgi:hypothetical protein